jgi:hypothetical protein
VLGWIHSGAVAKRTEEKAKQQGYVPYGERSGEGFWYDLGAWFIDPTNDADRAVPFERRFNMPAWRERIRSVANPKKPGETMEIVWDVGLCKRDIFGNPEMEKRPVVYRKEPDGHWVVASGDARDTPKLDAIISKDVSDSRLMQAIMADPCGGYTDPATGHQMI